MKRLWLFSCIHDLVNEVGALPVLFKFKALEVMKRELASGKKKVALFYGAGHLPDMERRLMSDFQMKRGGQFWMEAWKLAE